ncbi:MAG: hypothetical protein LAN18_11405 [Acidobacteriia bacterium]|nr:hypothetical protein [Terriglobia bacterium]
MSLVQGDVRFTRSAQKNDPLADQHLAWESAIANLPIRQGSVPRNDNVLSFSAACLD